jgi:putative glutathione S-transferase
VGLRTLIARKLKGLEEVISVSVVEPWLLEKAGISAITPALTEIRSINVEWLHQLYTQADPTFTGRATVPVLWDKKTHTIVNNICGYHTDAQQRLWRTGAWQY